MIVIQSSLFCIGILGILLIAFNFLFYIPCFLSPFCPLCAILYFCLFINRGYFLIILIYTCCVEITSTFFLVNSCTICIGIIQMPYLFFYILISFGLLNAAPCCIICNIAIIISLPFTCCFCFLIFQFVATISMILLYVLLNCISIIIICIVFSSFTSPLTCGPCLCYHFIVHQVIKIIIESELKW
jgi:hypothetical protein